MELINMPTDMEKDEDLRQVVADYLASHPGLSCRQVTKNLVRHRVRAQLVRDVAKEIGYELAVMRKPPSPRPAAPEGGIPIPEGARLTRRPATRSVREKLHHLPLDRGFTVEELVARFGVTEETIRNHANRLKCIFYLEVDPDTGRMEQVILNPATARKHAQT